MSNTLLNSDIITDEALRIVNNNLKFCSTIDRQHDNSFANEGAKIGSQMRIKKPIQYEVTDGATMVDQDTVQESVTLQCQTQKHVSMQFTSSELSMNIDDFSETIIKPAAVKLAAMIDNHVINTVYKSIFNQTGTPGTTPGTLTTWMGAIELANEFCFPEDNELYVMNGPKADATTVVAMAELFNPGGTISDQFKKGRMKEALGYNWFMAQSAPKHTTGARATATNLTTTDVSTDTSAILIKANAGTWALKAGDIITIDGVYALNPVTKVATANLANFVVKADATATTTGVAVSIDLPITTVGARKTVSALPANGAAVNFKSGNASTTYPQSLLYHKEFATMATADLLLPKGVDMASRKVQDNISMTFIRDFDTRNYKMLSRLDVIFGVAVQNPGLAQRITG